MKPRDYHPDDPDSDLPDDVDYEEWLEERAEHEAEAKLDRWDQLENPC